MSPVFQTKPSWWVDFDEIPELDLNQISYKCTARMSNLAEIQFRDLMNQDLSTHWVLFLSCQVFMNILQLKLYIFISDNITYFLIVNVVVAS